MNFYAKEYFVTEPTQQRCMNTFKEHADLFCEKKVVLFTSFFNMPGFCFAFPIACYSCRCQMGCEKHFCFPSASVQETIYILIMPADNDLLRHPT